MTFAEFRRSYPTAAFTASGGKTFTYRYYKNPQAKATLVLLTGSIGLSSEGKNLFNITENLLFHVHTLSLVFLIEIRPFSKKSSLVICFSFLLSVLFFLQKNKFCSCSL